MAEIKQLFGGEAHPPLTDIPAMLENLAEKIRSGEHGEVARLCGVMRCNGLHPIIYAFGECTPSQTFEDLHAGAQELLHMNNPTRS